MFVAISSFEIQNGLEEEVKEAFRNRPKLVENFNGFIRLDVLNPSENPAEIWLLTYWTNEESFTTWHKTHLKGSHQGIPKGLKLVPHSFKIRYFNHITS
ncbi:MAG: antibiotic biosynthesis monooxygenase [Ferruginibacter sp.]|nr:antibiotic biosynthesis monooxygenase [Ferruginibacter sp.]